MKTIAYDRKTAVEYARRWALSRNPDYYDFENIGGDCTNFISQCLFAGCRTMNYTKDTGWYYNSLNDRSAAWTSVLQLHRFLTQNKGAGAFGVETDLRSAQIGDIIQLGYEGEFYHSLMITDLRRGMPYVCAHTFDALDKRLGEYSFGELRCVHILGARTYLED